MYEALAFVLTPECTSPDCNTTENLPAIAYHGMPLKNRASAPSQRLPLQLEGYSGIYAVAYVCQDRVTSMMVTGQ